MKDSWKADFSGRRVLITGGAGFIGSHLARRLVDLGAQVCIVDVMDPDTGANLFNLDQIKERVELIVADINTFSKFKDLIQKQEFMFRLAGQTSHLGGMNDPVKDIEINSVSQVRMLDLCHKFNPGIRIVFASTRQVYGRPQRLPVDENQPLLPIDFNGVSKLAGDLYHLVSSQVYGLYASVLRMTNVYGPHMRVKDGRQNFIGWWVRQLLERGEIEIYGNGEQLRDLNYVDDVVDAILSCAGSPAGQAYNLGGEPLRLLDLAQQMIEIHGSGSYRLIPFPEERKRIDIGDYYGDYSKIQRELGWKPRVPLREGLERTLAFYRENQHHYW